LRAADAFAQSFLEYEEAEQNLRCSEAEAQGSERPGNYRTEKLVTVLRPEPEPSSATSADPFARGLNLLPTLDVYRRSCQQPTTRLRRETTLEDESTGVLKGADSGPSGAVAQPH
jgi:hypothetical protein